MSKVFLLNNIAQITDFCNTADSIVPHIINALDFASTYLLNKLKRT